jgi:hypothetical protein
VTEFQTDEYYTDGSRTVKGRSGPPGNQYNFKHGLSGIQKRREAGVITAFEDGIFDLPNQHGLI